MFFGEYNHTVDDKGRVTVPARFRPALAEGAVVTRGLDRCLVLYPNTEWEALAERVNALPMTDRHARDFRRFVFGSATEATPDRQGRALIPAYLRHYASIEDEVTVIGMNTYIEIWNPKAWLGTRQSVEDESTNAERWEVLRI